MMIKLIVVTTLYLVVPCTMAREACCDRTFFDRNFTGQLVSRIGSFLYEDEKYGGTYLRDNNNVTVCNLGAVGSKRQSLDVHVYNDYREEDLRVDVLSSNAWLIRYVDSEKENYDNCKYRCDLCAYEMRF
ncbi:hypothetical protein GCK32_020973 [Trichostrongylus colubriformis]|uniref:Uncharacterized protein n=1 Tax=Trichostrongylus colubriformis TaxID=6319 RepID=A0AAN8FWS5_TRICO